MSLEMTTSLSYLAWASALCLILWLPYVLERIMRQGLMTVLQYKDTDAEPAVWASAVLSVFARGVAAVVCCGAFGSRFAMLLWHVCISLLLRFAATIPVRVPWNH